jgi:ABC-2 type transport system permease protein/sodium transport system permease protein
VAAALALASRIFGTDVVLSGGGGTWGEVLRRPFEMRDAFRPATALFCLAVMFPTYFVAAGTLAQLTDDSDAERIVKSALVTVLVFMVIPLAMAVFQRVRQSSGFGLKMPGLGMLMCGIVLGVCLWPLAYEVFFLNEVLGIKPFRLGQYEAVREVAKELRQLSFPLIVIALGIVPGICEEYFFRGMLFGGLRQTLSGWGAVIGAAVVFGLFHVVSGNAFLPERFIPSAFLGLALGWVRWKSGSVVPCMLLHAIHNSLLLSLMFWETDFAAFGLGVQDAQHLPAGWIIVSVAVTGVVLWLIQIGSRQATAAKVGRD